MWRNLSSVSDLACRNPRRLRKLIGGIAAVQMEGPRGNGLFSGVVIEMEDTRCKSLSYRMALEIDEPRCSRIPIEVEDPPCNNPYFIR